MTHALSTVVTIADGQADGQWQTSNDADQAIANAVADILSIDFSGGNVTLTNNQFSSAMTFAPSGLSTTRTLTVPALKRALFVVVNTDSADTINVARGSTSIAVAAGEIGVFSTDGTANGLTGVVLESATGAAVIPYDLPLSFAGTPTTSQLIGKLMVVRDVDFAANFAGSSGHVGTNPTATFAIDVKDDGTSIGTISISTGGTFTFTTTSGTAKTVAAGSRIEFVAPASVDATVAAIAATLAGTA